MSKKLDDLKKADAMNEEMSKAFVDAAIDFINDLSHLSKKEQDDFWKDEDFDKAEALYQQGIKEKEEGKYEEALFHFARGYQTCDLAKLAREIGKCFYEGKGIRRNYKKAFAYFKECNFLSSDAEGQYYYGLCLLEGKGTHADYFEGLSLIEKAGRNKVKPAILKLMELNVKDPEIYHFWEAKLASAK